MTGYDGSVPMRPGGAQRLPNLYTDPIKPPPQRDATTPAAELKFLREGVDPAHWCPRCGLVVANEGQEIHRQHHAELSERIMFLSRMVITLVAHAGLVPPGREEETAAHLAQWAREGEGG